MHLFEDPLHMVAVFVARVAQELEARHRAQSHASTQLAAEEGAGRREAVAGLPRPFLVADEGKIDSGV